MREHEHDFSHRHKGPSLFWPIILIGVGVVFLLYNLGLLSADPWPLLARLWPLILVVIGLDILLGRRSVVGGIFSALFALLLVGGVVLLLFVAQAYPVLFQMATPELHAERIAHPLNDIRQAEVSIDFPGGKGYIVPLSDSANLLEGEMRYYGELINRFSTSGSNAQVQLSNRHAGIWGKDQQEQWTLGLNSRVEYNLTLDTGSGSYEFDLRQFNLRSLELDGGSGSIQLTLPETGQYHFDLEAGSGSINIHIPEGVAVRVEYQAGSGAFDTNLTRVSGDKQDGVYASPNFAKSGHYVTIRLDGGSGSVTIR